MEDQPPSKRNNFPMDPLLKIRVLEEFDEIINKVDIDAETILLRSNRNSHLKQPFEEELNRSRKFIIDQINEIKNINSRNLKLTSYSSEKPYLEIKHNLFVKYCVYLDSETARGFTFNKDRLGILLVTDFYMSESQAKKLSEMVSSVLKINLDNNEENEKILIDKYFMENFVILSKSKDTIFSDQYKIEFFSRAFDEITELKFQSPKIVMQCLNNTLRRFSSLKILHLKKASFDSINNHTFDINTLQELNLEFCKIKKIENNLFQGLKNLKILILNYNWLLSIEPQAFHNLVSLEKLDISHNSMTDIPDSIFSTLSNLKFLDLSHNSLKIIKKATLNGLVNLEHFHAKSLTTEIIFEENAFEELDNLKYVDIHWCSEINPVIAEPPRNLEEACIKYRGENHLASKWLSSSRNLTKLTLSNIHDSIKSSIFENCHNLKDLILDGVRIDFEKFPTDLKSLESIKLDGVKFLTNPENLFSNLINLKEVMIIYNEFSNVSYNPKMFQSLKNLKKLAFKAKEEIIVYGTFTIENKNQSNDNKYLKDGLPKSKHLSIDHIAENHPCIIELDLSYNSSIISGLNCLSKMNYLEKLKLNGNAIEELSDEFNGMVNLKHLDLTGNKLTRIESSVFSKDLNNLVEIILERNRLTNLTYGMFSNLVNLEKLNLAKTNIVNIEGNSFKGLHNLKHLNLSCNGLEQLDHGLFMDLINLQEINLRLNKIKSIDKLFVNNTKLEYLFLDCNNIKSVNFKLLANLVNLRCLDLQQNHIETIDLDELNYFALSVLDSVDINLLYNPIFNSLHSLPNLLYNIKFK